MQFKHSKTFNFEGAIRGMRNPMNSWDKSDSHFNNTNLTIGEKDLALMQKLILAGREHGKFMRQIFVSVDITAPIFWWKEMDTYKIGTTANSTSTMHKLISKPITINDFSVSNLDLIIHPLENGDLIFEDIMENTIYDCERLRELYLKTKDRRYWYALIQLLPESYNQTRTWTANYAILRNIYFQRKNHKLIEWHEFCDWIKSLPYSKELITLGDIDEN